MLVAVEDALDRGGRAHGHEDSLGETWRYQMVAEFEQAAEELKEQGVIKEYLETNADADASKQISDMEDLISKGVDGILIAVQNPT